MLRRPEFLLVNDTIYLVSVVREKGEVTDLHGPYQAISAPKMTPEAFVQEFVNILETALHTGKPLTLEDLPEKVKKDVEAAFNKSSSE